MNNTIESFSEELYSKLKTELNIVFYMCLESKHNSELYAELMAELHSELYSELKSGLQEELTQLFINE